MKTQANLVSMILGAHDQPLKDQSIICCVLFSSECCECKLLSNWCPLAGHQYKQAVC